MTAEQSMRLTPGQAGNLRWLAKVQFVIFGFCALPFAGIGIAGIAAFLSGGLYPAGTPWLMTAVTLLFLGVFLLAGLTFSWLSISTLRFAFRMSDLAVHWYEGVPVKVTFIYQQSANIGGGGSMLSSPRLSSAWLRHDGKKFAVDLDLFRKIPDQGIFRFYYVRRPGIPGLFTPYLIIDFKPVAVASESDNGLATELPANPLAKQEADPDCQCLTPSFRAADFSIAPVGTDETNGRFGDVSIATCNSCRRKWLHYHVEYEEFEKSGRWYRGPVSPETAQAIKPETAVALLGKMEWYFAGGSYFNSPGFKSSGPPAVGP